jgi:hypothetical protein
MGVGTIASFGAGVKVLGFVFLALTFVFGGIATVMLLALPRRANADLRAEQAQQQADLEEKLRNPPRKGSMTGGVRRAEEFPTGGDQHGVQTRHCLLIGHVKAPPAAASRPASASPAPRRPAPHPRCWPYARPDGRAMPAPSGSGGTGDILWVPGGEHGERDFPKVTAPPLDPGNRKKEQW